MFTPRQHYVATLVLMGLLLVGCGAGGSSFSGSGQVTCDNDFSPLLPPDWRIVSHRDLDPENETQPICIVFFQYEIPKNGGSELPMGGVIIRQDRNRPHDIHTYPLHLPNSLYLGEHQVSARVADVLFGQDGQEVIVEDKTPAGRTVEVSIFKWLEKEKSEDSVYESLGWFLGEGGVTVEKDRVIVLERRSETRSQLANRQIFNPRDSNKTYYQENSTSLVPPSITDVVSLNMPSDPSTSEYPEKIVLAFYENVTDTDILKTIVTEETMKAFNAADPVFDCLSQRTGALVKGITWEDNKAALPHTDNKNEVVDATVIVVSVCAINGRPSGKEMTLSWPVHWEKNKDKWELRKPSRP